MTLKLIENSQSNAIQRYQRIGPYEGFNTAFDSAGALSCDHRQITITRTIGATAYTEQANAYPVHLFDLTSGNFFTPGSPNYTGSVSLTVGRFCYAPCQWRLVAQQSGGPNPTGGSTGNFGQFYWFPETGQNASGGVVTPGVHWQTERNTSSIITNTTASAAAPVEYPFFSSKCYYNWADIRMALYGARSQTTKFTLSLVQITDRAYDPGIHNPRFNSAGLSISLNTDGNYTQYYTGSRTQEEQRNFDVAMQQLVQPLVFHPMHSSGATKISPFKTLMKKTFVIGPDTQVNEDEGQPNVLVKFFKNLNRMVNYAWSDQPTLTTDGTIDAPNYNVFTVPEVKGYAHPRAKLYLMVTSQAYTETGGDSGKVPGPDLTPGFDIVTYTGNGSARTISHSLGAVPHFMIVKARTTAGTDQGWPVYHRNLTSASYYLSLNATTAQTSDTTVWNGTAPTSSVFSVGTNALANTNNDTYLAYLWTEISGFSRFGSYTGNGSTDGPFVS